MGHGPMTRSKVTSSLFVLRMLKFTLRCLRYLLCIWSITSQQRALCAGARSYVTNLTICHSLGMSTENLFRSTTE
ncbi:hypothetical protein BDV06DRAFT_201762, partial [Aspergillus oleicola]